MYGEFRMAVHRQHFASIKGQLCKRAPIDLDEQIPSHHSKTRFFVLRLPNNINGSSTYKNSKTKKAVSFKIYPCNLKCYPI